VDDLVVTNQTTGATIATGAMTLAYDAAARTATWTFAGVARGVLPDGDYTARLKADQITLANGNMLDGNGDGMGGDDFTFGFTFLQGDINGDRSVDSGDLAILLPNLNTATTGFDHGDLNFDGTVGFLDYQVMQVAWHHTLPAVAPATGVQPTMMTVEAEAVPVAVTATPSPAKRTTKPAPKPRVAVKATPASPPKPVAMPIFSLHPLKRRDVDLLD
jgi:hypothetical protein